MKIVMLEKAKIGEDVSTACFEELGQVVVYSDTETREQCMERIKDADIVLVDQFPLDREILTSAEKLKFITMSSTGTDFVDLSCAHELGIQVANIRNYSTHSVAQLTLSLVLHLYENFAKYDSYVRKGEFIGDAGTSFTENPIYELYGKTYGIVGMGNIGREVARLAEAFGCKVCYYSPSGNTYDVPYEKADLETLLRESDIISLHSPLTEQTRNMFDLAALKKMKRTAVLINCARGALVVEPDMVTALKGSIIGGYATDVLTKEPMDRECPFLEIIDMEKLVITPHMGWAALESRQRAVDEMYLNTKAFLEGKERNLV